MKKSNVFTGSLLLSLCLIAVVLPVAGFEFSQAGYWPAPGSPRRVTNFNLGWEFSLDGFKTTRPVSLPHGIGAGGGVGTCAFHPIGERYRRNAVDG